MKKLTTLISVVAMMCAVIAALAFSIWAAVYGDSHYGFYKKEYQKYEVTEDLDMNIDHVMYVTEHMMNYLIGKEEKLSQRWKEKSRISSMKETGCICEMSGIYSWEVLRSGEFA